MIRVILGIIIVGFGMGGVENSISDFDLFKSCVVSAFGLLVMYSGVNVVKKQQL